MTERLACELDECDRPARGRGPYCNMHRQRQQKHGDPRHLGQCGGSRPQKRGEDNPNWSGDDIGYRGLHHRVVRERGPASRCSIFQCSTGSTAFDWACISGQYKDVGDFIELCHVHNLNLDGRPTRLDAGIKELIIL